MTQTRAGLPGAAISPARARDPAQVPAADGRQLRRVESDSGEGRDGADGPARAGLAPADGAARARQAWPRSRRCWNPSACWRPERARCRLRSRQLFDDKPAAATPTSTSALFDEFQARAERRAASAPPSRTPRTPTGWRVNAWVKKGILLGFRMGGDRRYVGRRRAAAVLRQGHLPGEAVRRSERRAHRARRLEHSRRLLPRQGRHLHAADVHQRRRLRGRRHHGRFARAGGQLRAGRQELPHLGGVARSAACWSRSARCR